jgi:Fe2+ or Zn2+ uptake regulation protein
MIATATKSLLRNAESLGGVRMTRQRREVYNVILAKRDHPTARQVFARVRAQMPRISLATVYNCLETLTECGLVRHVNLDRAPSRYCPNLEDHGHFFCTTCGIVFDISAKRPIKPERDWDLPRNVVVTQQEVALRGLCPECVNHHNL